MTQIDLSTQANPSNIYALLIGNELGFKNEYADLDSPAHDVLAFFELLQSKGIPTTNITVLLSPCEKNKEIVQKINNKNISVLEATVENIRAKLEELAKSKQIKRDLFFMLWSGHGGRVNLVNEPHLLLCADRSFLNRDALSSSLRSDYYNLPEQIIIINACNNILRPQNLSTMSSFNLAIGQNLIAQQLLMIAANPGEQARSRPGEVGNFPSRIYEELDKLPIEQWFSKTEDIAGTIIDFFKKEKAKRPSTPTPHFYMVGSPNKTFTDDNPDSDTVELNYDNLLAALRKCLVITSTDATERLANRVRAKENSLFRQVDFKKNPENLASDLARIIAAVPNSLQEFLGYIQPEEYESSGYLDLVKMKKN